MTTLNDDEGVFAGTHEACGRPWLDHTLRDLETCHPASMDQPFVAVAPPERDGATWSIAGTSGTVAGAVHIKATVYEATYPDGTPFIAPGVQFKFVSPNGLEEMEPISLILDDQAMRKLRTLVGEAIDAATRGARRRRKVHHRPTPPAPPIDQDGGE